jgi:hypothetical protein
MKVSISVDLSPEEARRFLGLPDVTSANEALVEAMQAKLAENVAKLDAENLMKLWFPGGIQGMEQMQKAFWSRFAGGAGTKKGERE